MTASVIDRLCRVEDPVALWEAYEQRGGRKRSSMEQFTNVLLAVLGVGFMVAAFKTTGLVSRGWKLGDPVHPITRAGRIIIFLTGVAALLAAVGVISK
jgi:hypothetical protein